MSDLTGKRIPKQTLHGSISTSGSSNPLRGNVMTRGLDGKSAYEYAVSKGYEGTEEEFAEKLAAEWARKEDIPENLTGSYNDLTDRPVSEDHSIVWLEQDVQLLASIESYNNGYVEVPFTTVDYDINRFKNAEAIIVFDRQEYNTVCYETETSYAFGYQDDTIPCVIYYNKNKGIWRVFPDKKGYTHYFSIAIKHIDIKQLDEKFIPDTILRTETLDDIIDEIQDIAEQMEPDLNQNDETSPSYIKGRTHYTEYDYSNVLLPVTTYTTSYGGPYYNYYYGANITDMTNILKSGYVYRVTYNDIDYIVEAIDKGSGNVYVGNLMYSVTGSNVSLDNGLPFYINGTKLIVSSDTKEVTLSIAEQKIIVHQLDEKYIPDTIAKKSDMPCYTETTIISETRTISRTLLDADFTQLLLKNRQSAEYLSNDKSFVYEGEVEASVPDTIGWSIVSEDGTRCIIIVHKSTDSVVEDRIQVQGPVLQITVNVAEEIVHQLDEKYIPNKYYTEYGTVQTIREFKTGTMFIDGNSNPDDMEFVQLVLNNRQTTTVNIDGITYTYKEDMNDTPEGVTLWIVVSENGAEVPMLVNCCNRVLMLHPFMDTCVIAVTHNGIKEIHQIDPKYIKDMYYDTSNRIYVNESIDVGDAKEVDEGLWNALITGNHENILLDGYHLEMLPVEDPAMHSFSVHEYRLDVFADSHGIGLMPLGTPPSEPKTCTISGYYETGELKQLDEKYIPDTIARVNFDELELLQETGVVDIVADKSNKILTDNNGKIYVL